LLQTAYWQAHQIIYRLLRRESIDLIQQRGARDKSGAFFWKNKKYPQRLSHADRLAIIPAYAYMSNAGRNPKIPEQSRNNPF